MSYLTVVGVILILMALTIYVVIFGQAPFHRNGCIGALNRFLTDGLWRRLAAVCQRVPVLRCCWTRVMRVADYAMNQKNPLVQLFYLGLIIPGWAYGLSSTYKFFPGVAAISVAWWWSFHAVGAATLLAFAKASFSDPGFVTPANEARYNAVWPRDGALYARRKACTECRVEVRPARSKHCGLCHHCVSKLDHHCPWINNCVGELNMRWFLLFLLMSAVFCLHGAWLLAGVLYGYCDKTGLLSPDLRYRTARNGPLLPASFALRLALLLRDTGLLAPLALFALLMGLVLVGFTAFQLYHVLRNTTTAETYKISDLVYIAEMSARLKDKKAPTTPEEEDFRQYVRYKDLPAVQLPYKHAYSHGAWRNFLEMAFPPFYYSKVKVASTGSAKKSAAPSVAPAARKSKKH